MNNTTSNTITVTVNEEALALATSIATIDEIEAYFHVERTNIKFRSCIMELNRAVYGKEML